jgi:hypothetical protein
MFRSTLKHLNPASLIAMVALFVALGGVSYAAATIGSAEIKNNSIRSIDVRNGGLTGKDLRKDSVGGAKIKESTLGQVPTAAKADSADTATSATTAQDAVNAQNAVNAQDAVNAQNAAAVGPNGVGTAAVQNGAVRASKLGGRVVRTGTAVSVPNGTSRLVTALCQPGETMLSGGAIWAGVSNATDASQLHVVHSYPIGATSWAARGYNATGAAVTLTPRALCLTN